MFFYLKISCKDKRLLKFFLRLFPKINFLSFFFKSFSKRGRRKVVTVLKSPHVNKTAQEQFEYRIYSRHLLVHSFRPFTFFALIKKLKNLSFPGLNLEVKGFLGNNKFQKQILHIVDPDNIIFKSTYFLPSRKSLLKNTRYKKNYNSELISLKKYIQLFDLYGEIFLKKFSAFSYHTDASLAQLDRATAF